MKEQPAATLRFQQKISEFCAVRIAPIVTKPTSDKIHHYLIALVLDRAHMPMRTKRIDWRAVADACGIDGDLPPALKRNLRAGLDAILRWRQSQTVKDRRRPAIKRLAPRHRTSGIAATRVRMF